MAWVVVGLRGGTGAAVGAAVAVSCRTAAAAAGRRVYRVAGCMATGAAVTCRTAAAVGRSGCRVAVVAGAAIGGVEATCCAAYCAAWQDGAGASSWVPLEEVQAGTESALVSRLAPLLAAVALAAAAIVADIEVMMFQVLRVSTHQVMLHVSTHFAAAAAAESEERKVLGALLAS